MTLGNSDPLKRVKGEGRDRGVSPVIGVILMVAITVILAAVIGVFVLGLGDQLGDGAAPSTSMTIAQNLDDGDGEDQFDLTLNSGDALNEEDLTLLLGGAVADVDSWNFVGGELTTGETVTVDVAAAETNDNENDYDITIRHDPSDSILVSADEVTIDGGTTT